jgi:hypothetical protein
MVVSYYTVGPGTLTIGSSGALMDFSAQTTSVKLTPSVDNGDPINVLSGEQVAGDRTESFTLDGTVLQDLGADSRAEWLFLHRGETHPFEFVPATAAARKISGSLVVEAVDLGGDVKTKPTSDFSFVVIGEPTIAAAAVE